MPLFPLILPPGKGSAIISGNRTIMQFRYFGIFRVIVLVAALMLAATPSMFAAEQLDIDFDADPGFLSYGLLEKQIDRFSDRQIPLAEFIRMYSLPDSERDSTIIIRAENGDYIQKGPASFFLIDLNSRAVIDQDPFWGILTGYTVYYDNKAGKNAILGYGYYNDSAFVFKDVPLSEKVERLFLTTGVDNSGDGEWQAGTRLSLVEDYDFDGIDEVFLQVCPGRDLEPRELFCIDPVNLRIEWSLPVAGAVGKGSLVSCRDSLDPAVMFITYNYKNGVVDDNFDDFFGYLAKVNSRGEVEYKAVVFADHGPAGIWPSLTPGEFLVYHGLPMLSPDSVTETIPHQYQISKIDRYGKTLERYDIPHRLQSLWYCDFKGDGIPEIYTLSTNGVVRVYDGNFKLLAESGETNLTEMVDTVRLRGMNLPSFVFRTSSGLDFYSPRLQKMASLPGDYYWVTPLVYDGDRAVKLMAAGSGNGCGFFEVSHKNIGQFASVLFWRYKNEILIVLTMLALALVVVNAFRMRTARKLTESERLLDSILKNSMDGFYRISLDGTVEWASESALKIFGFKSVNDVIGRNVIELYKYPEHRDILLDRLSREGRVSDYELHMKRLDGSTIVVSLNSYLIYDRSGKPEKVEGVLRDITSRRSAEDALKDTEMKYRTLVESSGEAVFMVNQNGVFLFLNSVAAKRLGGAAENFIGKNMHELFPSEAASRQLNSIKKVLRTGRGELFDSEVVLQGKKFRYRTSLQPIHNGRGEPDSVLGIGRDITSLFEATERLKSEKIFAKALFNTSNSMIVCLNEHAEITMFNDEMERVTGYKREEVLGKNWEKIFVPEEHHRENIPFLDWVRKNPHDRYERDIIIRTGERRLILWSNSALFYPDSNEFTAIAIGVDITDRKKIEREAEQAHNELRQIFNAAAPMCVIDRDFNMVQINEPYTRLFGRKPDEELGRKCYSQWPGDFCRSARCPMMQITSGKESYQYEWESTLADGAYVATIVTAKPYRGPDGEIQGIVESYADITERKLAENRLAETEMRFDQALQNSRDILFRYNFRENKFDYISDAVLEITGFTPEEARKMRLQDNDIMKSGIHPDDREKLGESIDAVLGDTEHSAIQMEYRFQCKDGSWKWLSDSCAIVRNSSGMPLFMIGSSRDVTEQRETQEALRRGEEFHRAIFEHSPLGVSVRSRYGQLLSYNRAWKAIWAKDDKSIAEDMNRVRTELRLDVRDSYFREWAEKVKQVYEEGGYLYVPEVKSEKHRSGTPRWLSQHFYAIKDAKGEVDRVVILTEDITERKMAAEALKESEQRFKAIASAIPIPIAIARLSDGKLMYVNDLLAPAFGYCKEEVIGTSSERFYAERETRGRVAEILRRDGSVENFELKGVKKDGTIFWALITLHRIKFNNEDAAFGGFIDITEIKRTEEELRRSEERFRELADLLPQTVFEIDLMGNILYANRQGYRSFGYDEEDVKRGLNIARLFAADDVPAIFRNMERQIRGEDVRGYEYQALRRNGTNFPIIAYSTLSFREGFPVGMRGIVVDISERIEAEKILAESERKFRDLAEHSIQATFVAQNGKVVFVNRRLAEIGEVPIEKILDSPPEFLLAYLVDSKDRRRLYRDILKRMRGSQPIDRYELKIGIPSGGIRWVEAMVGSISYNGEPAIMGTLIDITDRVKAVEKMHAADQYKFEMAKRTAGFFAHEIRNALYPASLVLPRLVNEHDNEYPENNEVRECAAIADKSIKRAAKLTRAVNNFTKLDSERAPEVVKLSDVIYEIINQNQFRIKESGVEIEIKGKTGTRVVSNRNHLTMALNNFIANALDALTGQPEPRILIEWGQTNEMINLTIADNGKGIAETDMHRIFELFFSTKSDNGGTGIGLAYAKRVVEMYGGYAEVDSKLNHGAKFTVKMVSGDRLSRD